MNSCTLAPLLERLLLDTYSRTRETDTSQPTAASAAGTAVARSRPVPFECCRKGVKESR